MVRNVGLVKIADSKKFRERASYFRRLAIGAGDPEFTGKLGALGHEYEAVAIEADAQAASDQADTVGDRR